MHGADAPWLDTRSLGTAPCAPPGSGEPVSSCGPVTAAYRGTGRVRRSRSLPYADAGAVHDHADDSAVRIGRS
jgi:hypothetical protein